MRFPRSILALAALAAPAAAVAQADNDTVTVRIAIADIDLGSADGRAKLEQRLDTSLRAACTLEANSRYNFGRDIVDQKCLTEARTAALAEAERIAAARARAGGQVAAN